MGGIVGVPEAKCNPPLDAGRLGCYTVSDMSQLNNPSDPIDHPSDSTIRHRILSLGAGVQSTCVYLLALSGAIPQFEAAVFADTGEEPDEVYRHLDWLDSLGGAKIYRVRQHDRALGDQLIRGLSVDSPRHIGIPAFAQSEPGEAPSIVLRQCTSEYKIKPIDRWVRRFLLGRQPKQRVQKGASVIQSIGISLDEVARAVRVLRNNDTPWLQFEFPLVRMGWSRQDCLRWLADKGYPKPPRSACTFCPYKSDSEWLRTKTEDPKGWARAIQIDRAIRDENSCAAKKIRSTLFLHRSCVPIDQVDFEARIAAKPGAQTDLGFWQECQGMCGN